MPETSFGNLISTLPQEDKACCRKLENLRKKLINNEYAVVFNEICLRENLLPRYTDVRLYDEAVRNNATTLEYRRALVVDELERKISTVNHLRQQVNDQVASWNGRDIDDQTKARINAMLESILSTHKDAVERKGNRKLAAMNGGQIKVPQPTSGYVNLADVDLDYDQKELLGMGLNCHVLSKPKPHQKRVEVEVLIENILSLANDGKVNVSQHLQPELVAESRKQRGSFASKMLQKRHIEAANRLRDNPDVTIRRADKASVFVLVPTSEYLEKVDAILGDRTKFQPLQRNPIPDIITRINATIDAINAVNGGTKFSKLSGEYRPGYCYGNVKTHKPNNPLRPIISQIPTPTYVLAKKLNGLLTPFVPNRYSLASSKEFLDLVKDAPSSGIIASLDVESLFTNVPVDRTIDFICNKVYRSRPTPGLDIPEVHLRTLLEACTKQAPFRCPRGKLYLQTDGVAMGSPLGVLFANFFMGTIEELVFSATNKPDIYCRYIDDIFVKIKSVTELDTLREKLMEVSGLNFTVERSDEGSLPFLDVLLKQNNSSFSSSVFIKATNPGLCMNGESECPQRYKDATIGAFFRRALTHCSTWQETQKEIDRVQQLLVNNGYSNREVQAKLRRIIDGWYQGLPPASPTEEGTTHKIFYKSHMSTKYKEDERAIKDIIRRNVTPRESNDKLSIIIYYRSKKTSSLLMKNDTAPRPVGVRRSHVVYKFTCPEEDCTPLASYVGMTTTTLSRRLTLHLQQGGPKEHLQTIHGRSLDRETIVNQTEIIAAEKDPRRLAILEAVIIKEMHPSINRQVEDFATLPSMRPLSHRLQQRPPTTQPQPIAGPPPPATLRRSTRLLVRTAQHT